MRRAVGSKDGVGMANTVERREKKMATWSTLIFAVDVFL
jgi:hypothetical protein